MPLFCIMDGVMTRSPADVQNAAARLNVPVHDMDCDIFLMGVFFHQAIPFFPGISIVVCTDRVGFFPHGQVHSPSEIISKKRLSVRDKRLVD